MQIHSTRTKIVEYATALNDIELKLKKCTEEEVSNALASNATLIV